MGEILEEGEEVLGVDVVDVVGVIIKVGVGVVGIIRVEGIIIIIVVGKEVGVIIWGIRVFVIRMFIVVWVGCFIR